MIEKCVKIALNKKLAFHLKQVKEISQNVSFENVRYVRHSIYKRGNLRLLLSERNFMHNTRVAILQFDWGLLNLAKIKKKDKIRESIKHTNVKLKLVMVRFDKRYNVRFREIQILLYMYSFISLSFADCYSLF